MSIILGLIGAYVLCLYLSIRYTLSWKPCFTYGDLLMHAALFWVLGPLFYISTLGGDNEGIFDREVTWLKK